MIDVSHEKVCSECGSPNVGVVNEPYDFTESGLDNVRLVGVPQIICFACDNRSICVPNLNGLMRALGRAVVEKPCSLSPKELRFLRKMAGLTQDDLAKRLSVQRSTVARWESEGNWPASVDVAIRGLWVTVQIENSQDPRSSLQELYQRVFAGMGKLEPQSPQAISIDIRDVI